MRLPGYSADRSFRKSSRRCCAERPAEGIRPIAGNHLLAPNEYIITLGMHDYQKVGADPDLTSDAFAKHLARYIGEQGWQTYGDVVIRFEQSANLHTGQFRTRGAVNPDVEPRPTAGELAPPQSDRAFSAEPGVPAMSENSSYGGGQGQGRPGDDYYDDPYAHPHDDPHAAPDPRGGGYQPEPGGYPDQRGGYPDQGGYPPQYEQRPAGGYPDQAGYPRPARRLPRPARRLPRPAAATPTRRRLPRPARRLPRAARRLPRPGRLPAAIRAAPGRWLRRRPGLRAASARAATRRPPARATTSTPTTAAGGSPRRGRLRPPDQRGGYPDQGPGYDQGYGGGGYGRQDYGQQPEYGRPDYGQSYAPPGGGGGYAEPGRDYDYGQPADAGGYGGGYGQQGGYSSSGSAVTLQLDDGSGRTYQLREGPNVIGRGQDAQFRLPDTGVSRRHLEIRWDGQVALLSDLNSTNGTTVNNAPVQEWQLADGDVIRLGHSEIVVHIH